ncbi:nuclease-related domain-containing protein [Niallia sp. Krafla_26]|uniref:nuclease-related domain-containing protein n=1 Tax=Niallia sp. Krafla_26 TaxID=3064703 RepID=UPI003D179367
MNIFRKEKKVDVAEKQKPKHTSDKNKEKFASRKGDIGEYKTDIQLSQFPKNYLHISDLLIRNYKSLSGYSQIDHVIITPYGIFVIETKNYQGTVYGGEDRKTWSVNGKFKMMNPLKQNYGHIQALIHYIGKEYERTFVSIISFTKRCTFKIDPELRKISSDQLVIYDIELTEFINRKIAVRKLQHNEPLLMQEDITTIYQSILNANITDAAIREKHKLSIQKQVKINETNNTCVICNKQVSEKVTSYCLANKKFKGKIYCYDHQKMV